MTTSPHVHVESGLAGKEVALAGHFASMTQDDAARIIEAAGGRWVRAPRESTDLLVIGQEGWPFEQSGRVTHNVALARRLRAGGAALEVINEQAFMEMAGLGRQAAPERRQMYSTAELARLLDIPGPRIRSWARRGLIAPAQSDDRVDWYDFRQVTALRQLAGFAARGVRPETILASLEHMRGWMPEADDALAMLSRFVAADEMVLDDGTRIAPSGQLRLPLVERGAGQAPAPIRGRPGTELRAGEEWLAEGRRLDEDGDFEEAERAYRKALLVGAPRGEASFHLAEVLARRGLREEALVCYQEAVRAAPELSDAWSRMTGVLVELERFVDAVDAGERAVAADPDSPSAHFHLALALLACGRGGEARLHGRVYLRHDASSPMAGQLRELLDL